MAIRGGQEGNGAGPRGPFWPFQSVTSVSQLAFLAVSCTVLTIVFSGVVGSAFHSMEYPGPSDYSAFESLLNGAMLIVWVMVLPIAGLGTAIGYIAGRAQTSEARIGMAGMGFMLGFLAGILAFIVIFFVFLYSGALQGALLGGLAGFATAVVATIAIVRLDKQKTSGRQ
ncbi:hypothetical protein [Candidatus Nitrososphaera sp. FF02]|uniref:hypothetical protein n=1 Tax=Candidatus Nitrososphaera sp. FF02 TaxID=3398226 RepID=UPI0039E94F6F